MSNYIFLPMKIQCIPLKKDILIQDIINVYPTTIYMLSTVWNNRIMYFNMAAIGTKTAKTLMLKIFNKTQYLPELT